MVLDWLSCVSYDQIGMCWILTHLWRSVACLTHVICIVAALHKPRSLGENLDDPVPTQLDTVLADAMEVREVSIKLEGGFPMSSRVAHAIIVPRLHLYPLIPGHAPDAHRNAAPNFIYTLNPRPRNTSYSPK